MRMFLWNILLATAWAAGTGRVTLTNLIVGFVFSYFVLWFLHRVGGAPSPYFYKVRQVIGFSLFFAKELILANLRVAYEIITPWKVSHPGVIGIPLDAETDLETVKRELVEARKRRR